MAKLKTAEFLLLVGFNVAGSVEVETLNDKEVSQHIDRLVSFDLVRIHDDGVVITDKGHYTVESLLDLTDLFLV